MIEAYLTIKAVIFFGIVGIIAVSAAITGIASLIAWIKLKIELKKRSDADGDNKGTASGIPE